MFGIVSVSIFMDHNDNIFLIKSTKKDKDFPLEVRTTGCKLEELKISGKSKNELIDLIYDTQKNKLIQRKININYKCYLATSILLNSIINNISIKNKDLFLYPPDRTIIIYFSELDFIKSSIKEVLTESNFSIIDFIKLFGIKNLLVIVLIFNLTNILITNKIVQPIINNFNEIFLNYIVGD